MLILTSSLLRPTTKDLLVSKGRNTTSPPPAISSSPKPPKFPSGVALATQRIYEMHMCNHSFTRRLEWSALERIPWIVRANKDSCAGLWDIFIMIQSCCRQWEATRHASHNISVLRFIRVHKMLDTSLLRIDSVKLLAIVHEGDETKEKYPYRDTAKCPSITLDRQRSIWIGILADIYRITAGEPKVAILIIIPGNDYWREGLYQLQDTKKRAHQWWALAGYHSKLE